MKPEKLKSGNWRCRVYIGKDANGKKKSLSVTAPTKKEALAKAAELQLNNKSIQQRKLTVGYCIDAYIKEKESELSPHTVQGYKSMAKIRYDSIRDIPLSDLSTRDMQMLMSELSGLSAKTKKNVLGLLTAALRYFDKPLDTSNVKIGRQKKEKINTPTHEQIFSLIESAEGELKLAILLGALCGMRRGEIFALRADHVDLKNKRITVDSALVIANGVNEIRAPKTETSNRIVDMPDIVVKAITPYVNSGNIFSQPMNTLMKRFYKLRDSVPDCENVRFHDLRHYYASALIVAGVPDIYAMKMGGWATPNTLKRVYQDIFGDQFEIERSKVNATFNQQFKK